MSLLELAEEAAEQFCGESIEAIHVKIGALSGVVPSALEAAYELAREQSPFQSCRLIIEPVAAVMYCANCASERPLESLLMLCCPVCGVPASNIVRGRELELCALELKECQSPAL